MDNQQVASLLSTIADLLDLRAEMPFKVRAYRMAAQTIETLPEDITTLVHENRLRDLPGIGEALAKKITEYVQTGTLAYLEDLKKETPPGLIDLLKIPASAPARSPPSTKNSESTPSQTSNKRPPTDASATSKASARPPNVISCAASNSSKKPTAASSSPAPTPTAPPSSTTSKNAPISSTPASPAACAA